MNGEEIVTYTPRHARQAARLLLGLVTSVRAATDPIGAKLCPHHRQALSGWHDHWRHESAEDFDERRAAYIRQCCGRFG